MSLLFDKHPLIVNPTLATLIGLNESIILQQIHYWLELNKQAGRNKRNGQIWTYNSYENWQEQFPFWSLRTIRRTFTILKNRKLIITANYNKLSLDRTIWYRINYNKLKQLYFQSPCGQNDHMDMANLAAPIPETITSSPCGILDPSWYVDEMTRKIADQTS